jgi:hypothetical protein
MSPLLPRRRSRRRSASRRLVATLVVAVLLALLIGGLTQVSSQSRSYDEGANRSLATLGGVVATESSTSAVTLRHLLSTMAGLTRPTLQSELDGLVQQTAVQSAAASQAAPAGPTGSLPDRFAGVFASRARAVAMVRSAIDGLLGLHPLAVAGLAGSGVVAATPTLLSASQATSRIADAGALLIGADRSYRTVRTELARALGRAHLPASTWVTDAQTWELGAVDEQVDLLAASTSLAATRDLVLRTVQLSPPALPTAAGTDAGTSVLSPTSTVMVSVVLSNEGTVDEPGATVQVALAPLGGGSPVTRTLRTGVPAGGSFAFNTITFGVKAGHAYQLSVAVVLPPGQLSSAGSSMTQVLEIAPGT